MKREYREGDWFLVPLPDGRTVAGIVTAAARTVSSGYFFREPANSPEGALGAYRFFDEALHEERWPVVRAQPGFERAAWPAIDGDPVEPRCLQTFLAARLEGRQPARDRLTVWDVREPVDTRRFERLPAEGTVRLQWRLPLTAQSLDAVSRAAAARGCIAVRLYGDAMEQTAPVAMLPPVRALALEAQRIPDSAGSFPHATALAFDGVPSRLAALVAGSPHVKRISVDARGGRLDVAAFAGAERLERVDVANADIVGAAQLSLVPVLRTLELRETSVDDVGAVVRNATLEALRLRAIPNLRSLEALRGHTRLKMLALENLTRVDDVAPLATLQQLTSLTLTGMWQLHPDNVAFLADLPNLRSLALDIGGRRKNVEIYRRRPFAEPVTF
ncbi:MAG: hypothetical protein JO199_09600 [Candidatus Eremiobacteraeota bacterium]|nr:hypothetical protein [Candidatus Eremiobacteraeota bacterium]